MPYIRDDTGREKRCAQRPAVTTRRELTTRSSSKDDAKRSLTCNFCNTHEFFLPTITVTLVLKTGVKFTESVVVQTDKTGKMYFTSEVVGVLNVPPPGECQFQPYLKISHCAIVKTIV